jgi:hypothetical protein
MPQMKTLVVTLLSIVAFGGCTAPPSGTPDDYAGEYVFTIQKDPGLFANMIVLRKDGTALEVRVDKVNGTVTTTETKWRLERGTANTVVIGDRAYPIERSGPAVRLQINYDLDEYYSKVR